MLRIASTVMVLFSLCALASDAGAQPRPPRQPGDIAVPDRVFGWYENNRIFVEVMVVSRPDELDHAFGIVQSYVPGERFGNRVGHVIPVRFRIFVLKGEGDVRLNFEPLSASPPRLTEAALENPDWHLARKEALNEGEEPLIINVKEDTQLAWGGKLHPCARMVQINALVQTMKDPRFRMNLWLEFKYAVGNLPGGAPDWRLIETPDYWVDLSRTADPGPDLSLGDRQPVRPQRPYLLAYTLLAAGLLLIFTPAVYYGTRWLRRTFGAVGGLDPVELFWHTVRPVLKRCRIPGAVEQYVFKKDDVAVIVAATEQYLGTAAWPIEELWERRFEVADGERWYQVLEPLKRGCLQLGKDLPPERLGEIVQLIRLLCPRT